MSDLYAHRRLAGTYQNEGAPSAERSTLSSAPAALVSAGVVGYTQPLASTLKRSPLCDIKGRTLNVGEVVLLGVMLGTVLVIESTRYLVRRAAQQLHTRR